MNGAAERAVQTISLTAPWDWPHLSWQCTVLFKVNRSIGQSISQSVNRSISQSIKNYKLGWPPRRWYIVHAEKSTYYKFKVDASRRLMIPFRAFPRFFRVPGSIDGWFCQSWGPLSSHLWCNTHIIFVSHMLLFIFVLYILCFCIILYIIQGVFFTLGLS